MSLALQEQVDAIETRTDSLESVLARFIMSTNTALTRLERSVDDLRQEMKEFKDELRADTKKFKEELRADTKKFKEEIRADTKTLKEEMREFKDEIRADTKRLNKKMGELSNKMGTLVEDMIAPGLPGIAAEYFGDSDLDFFGVRIRKRKKSNPSVRREFDIIAVSDRNFYICETKSKPKPENADEIVKLLDEIGDYFPESEGKNIVPILSSLYFPEDLLTHLTRKGIYAVGMKEGIMALLNFQDEGRMMNG